MKGWRTLFSRFLKSGGWKFDSVREGKQTAFVIFLKSCQTLLLRFLVDGYWLVPITWGIIVVAYSPYFGLGYSSDSMGYFLLANNLMSGLGYASQAIRDFYIDVTSAFAEPSRSFPPLLPVLIGIVAKLSGKGIASGLIVNIFVLLAHFHVHYLTSKELFGKYFYLIFLMLPFFFLTNDPFSGEWLSGRSIPLAALLVSCVIYLLVRKEQGGRSALFFGGALGLLYLTRTDTLIFCVLILAFYVARSKIRKDVIMAFVGLGVVVFPWTIRNLVTFGQIFASDNTVTALSTYQSIVTICFFENGFPSWKDNPNLWITQRISYFMNDVQIIIGLLKPSGGIYALLIATVGFVSPKIAQSVKPLFILTLTWLLSQTFAISLTSYSDHRYFTISAFLVSVCAIATVLSYVAGSTIRSTDSIKQTVLSRWRYLLPGLTLVLTLALVNYFVKDMLMRQNLSSAPYENMYSDFKAFVGDNDRVAYREAEHLAYYSTWRTIYMPVNIDRPDNTAFEAWVKKFNVRFALVADDSIFAKHPTAVVVASSRGLSLVDLRASTYSLDYVSDSTYDLTDSNWTNGVAKNWAGFFVANRPANVAQLTPGKKISFADGSTRTIVRQEQSDVYLNIFLNGLPLDGSIVGYPKKFKIRN